jgi:NAD(P)-dependent dehydrogenase (short-subunit alcohol dehydrogenase family)
VTGSRSLGAAGGWFAGRVAYVTGGASGIGRQLAAALRREGAVVEVANIQAKPPDDVADSPSVADGRSNRS